MKKLKIWSWPMFIYLLALLAVLYGLLKIFGADEGLLLLKPDIAAFSAIIYLLGMALWCIGWGGYLKMRPLIGIKLGFASQIGGLTPLSLGADLLRGYYAEKAGIKFTGGVAASLAAKFHKILIALVFSAFGIGLILLLNSTIKGSLLLGLGMPGLMLIGIYLLTKNYFSILVSKVTLRKIKAKDAGEFSKGLKGFIRRPPKAAIIMLLLSLICEFASFYLCFYAVGMSLDPLSAYLIFVLLFFASKALVPQGLGVTEIIGLVLLGNAAPMPLIAASLLLWNIVRIWVPLVFSGIAVFVAGKK